jgi:hypothetical protein
MAWLIEKVVARMWGYSPKVSFVFVPENSLGRYCKANVPISFPGKHRPQGTRYFFKNARGLGRLAKTKATATGCAVGAVLFRDSDGTRSSPSGEWEAKVASIEAGFDVEEFPLGVAMIPRPKSEAWLLCAVKPDAYQNCTPLEDASGNDASPNSLKKQLDIVLDGIGKTTTDLPNMVENDIIDAHRIDMPSYARFRIRMQEVARLMMRRHAV